MKRIYLLVGPSGSGKTTIGSLLKERGFAELVSHTTREPRSGEIEGVSYYFVCLSEFNALEKIEQTEYAGNSYALTMKEVKAKLEENEVVFAVVDINGAKQIKQRYPEATKTIFLQVTLDEIRNRMTARGDSVENVNKRAERAVKEGEFDNWKFADFVARNENLQDSLKNILVFIMNDIRGSKNNE